MYTFDEMTGEFGKRNNDIKFHGTMTEKEWKVRKYDDPEVLERFNYNDRGMLVAEDGTAVTPRYLKERIDELGEKNPLLHVYFDIKNETISGLPWEKKVVHPNGPTGTELGSNVKELPSLADRTIAQKHDDYERPKRAAEDE